MYPAIRASRSLMLFSLATMLGAMPPVRESPGRIAPSTPMPGPGSFGTPPPGPRAFHGGEGRPGASLPRPTPISRGRRPTYFPGTRTLIPPPGWNRCSILPNALYWRHRDILMEIQWLARTGFIPVTPIGSGVSSLSDYAMYPAGWRAYGVAVPPGGRIQVEVSHPKLAWFRLLAVDKWGRPAAGMFQAAYAYRPVMVTLSNPQKEAEAVYLIVDDPGWWSTKADPYTLTVRRDWDPRRVDLSGVKMVSGLWGATPSVSAEFRGPSLTGPAVYPH